MQLIEYCQKVFQLEGLDIYLRPYQIVSTGRDCGLVEFIENAQVSALFSKSVIKANKKREISMHVHVCKECYCFE
jgi:phosphatidylinositol kinase/protein kinase (PI-3  family)